MKVESKELGRYQDYGLGVRMILSQDQTFRLVLTNSQGMYNSIWNKIMSTAYNKYQTRSKLLVPKWVWAGEKTRLQLMSENTINDRILLNDSIEVNAIKDPFIANSYELTVYPDSGYNSISFQGERLRFFAFNSSDFPLVKSKELRDVQLSLPKTNISKFYLDLVPLSPIYGFLLFLFGLAVLWFDERLYG